jgi:hypothetical protein
MYIYERKYVYINIDLLRISVMQTKFLVGKITECAVQRYSTEQNV